MESWRIVVLTCLLLLPLGGLQARLVNLQLSNSSDYIGDMLSTRRSLDLAPAIRGRILDRNGKEFARDEWSFDLHVVLEEFEKRPEARADLQKLLGMAADDYQEAFDKIYQRIDNLMNPRPVKERPRIFTRERRTPYVLFKNIPRDAAATIEIGLDRFPGLVVREGHRRVYPLKELGAHVIGFLGRASANEEKYRKLIEMEKGEFEELIGEDGVTLLERRGLFKETLVGSSGVERSYDDRLRGHPGLMILEREPETGKKTWVELKPAVNGEDLELTIDIDIQMELDKALNEARPNEATAMIADCKTGAIIAMGSNSTFDPNDFIPPTNNAAMKEYFDPKKNLTLNRCVQGRYQLGSIFKIATSVAGLEERAMTPGTIFPCNGRYKEGLQRFNCWIWNEQRGTHGDMDLKSALAQSCNCYYFATSEHIGFEKLAMWYERFGFGKKTGIDLPGEANGFLPMPGNRSWKVTDSYSLVIGQHELAVTPTQVLAMMCAIANGGMLVTPHVGSTFQGETSNVGFKQSTLDAVYTGLKECVQGAHGTAHATTLKDIDAAGKTGTAQTSGKLGTHAWFAGLAPVAAPRFAFIVLVEHGGHGGAIAAPIAAKFATKAMSGETK